ncbi:MAG: antitoxin [Caedimonas sp.]|nr:antitoxin [Caedimonas sp.]
MSRLTINITDQQHQALKAMAALQGKTIKEYAIERLFPEVGNDEQAMVDLRQLLEMRVAEVSRGEVSTKSITEIASEVMQTGGIA